MMFNVLKQELELRGISLDEAAEIADISRKTLDKCLSGDRDFYVHEILRLQVVLHDRGSCLTLEEMVDPEMTEGAAAR